MASQPKNLTNTETNIRITLHGYGGECYMGDVPRETYEFFKKHKIDIEQYAGDWGDVDWTFIPDEHQFFPPGSPFECTNLGHQTGATMEDSSSITIEDQNGNEIWRSGLDPNTLRKNGVAVDIFDEVNLEHAQNGDVIFWGGQGEKGTFFSTEISITTPFDPSNLKIYCSNLDGWLLSSGIEYDGEEIEGFDGYDTTGKWSENKFHVVGGEEVYEGKERDGEGNIFNEEDMPSGYQNFPQDWEKSSRVKKANPKRIGWYECNYSYGTTYSTLYWNGYEWQSFSKGRPIKECDEVDWWYGYNWDTSDWKNRPKDPPEVRCKKCNWLGDSEDMLPGPENLTSELACPNCKAKKKNIDWIIYDPDIKEGRNNRKKYC